MSEATIDDLDEVGQDTDALLAGLWTDYVAGREAALRDRLILHYAPLVKYSPGAHGSGARGAADLVSYAPSGYHAINGSRPP